MPKTSPPLTAAVRHVRITLAHVDRLLTKALDRTGIPVPGAFSREYDDFSADEVFLLSETAAEIRAALLALARSLGVPPEPPTIPARWAAQTDWHFAEVALAELSGAGLRAWGGADPERERLLKQEAERLRARLAEARSLLAGGRPGVRANPEALAPGAALAPLRALLEVPDLTPLNGALRALAGHLREPDLVIGVFGRVSTGKSSLINAALGEEVLPVGAVPVTRRVLRIRRGEKAVRLLAPADGVPETRPWSERGRWLAQPAADGRRCELLLPAVPAGTAWLDTPGLGATDPVLGAAAPRAVWACDMVLLTLGAGALPGLDERAILARARAQGIPLHLLLAQADRLTAGERQDLLAWLSSHVADAASIGAVSTRSDPGFAHLAALLERVVSRPAQERNALRRSRLLTVLAEAERLVADTPDALRAVEAAREAIAAMVAEAPAP